jgi:DNA-binding MarR family transcriptional regulator
MIANQTDSKKQKTEISGFIIERTAKKMKQSFKRMLTETGAGITVDQWVILQELEKEDGLSQYEIAARTFKDAPTVTRIIDLLCDKKLLERLPDQEDRRKFNIFLTDSGKSKIVEILPIVESFRAEAWNGLSDVEINQLRSILNTIFKNLT